MKAASSLHVGSPFMYVTAATPVGTMGRLSMTEHTYLPVYLVAEVYLPPIATWGARVLMSPAQVDPE